MPIIDYKGLSLKNKIFWGFLFVCLLCLVGTTVMSFIVLKNNTLQLSKTDQRSKTNAIMAALDYSISKTETETTNLKKVLGNAIYEIADINKHDIIIYDLEGNYLLSNKDYALVTQKKINQDIVRSLKTNEFQIDIESYDQNIDANVFSSYIILKNNILKPIGIVYIPYYHSDSGYLNILIKHTKYILGVNLIVIAFSILISWYISRNVTNTINKFSKIITKITLFGDNIRPIKYLPNDELSSLVKSYNKMILQIQDQKERLAHSAKESAWREMAKQVAHEVKNPLTPMKLTIQNFERKFDPTDPSITEKVKKLSTTLISQIDTITAVADAFSQFEQLPQKNDETFHLKEEILNIIQIFNDKNIFIHAFPSDIMIHMDKTYLNRMIVNLITNAQQAKSEDRPLIINIDIEKINKNVKISVEDNGIGIPEGMFEKIFEPNFTSKSSGKGLGLSMINKMVKEYNGEISLKSEVGKGSRFTIKLPTI